MSEPENQSPPEAGQSFPSLPRVYMPDLPLADLSADESGDTVTDRHLLVVRSRLIANLGNALASWFQIVPSDQASGELSTVALLLEAHLPILVPVNDLEAGPVFFVTRYDIDAHRLKAASEREPLAAHFALSDALLAADTGFQELKRQADVQRPERSLRINNAGAELPEERWLRHQLARRMSATEANA